MGWGRYAAEAAERASEIEELLTKDDVAVLRDELSRQSRLAWARWMEAHRQLALAYIAATPSERKRAVRFRLPNNDLLLLRLTSLIFAKHGLALLQALSSSRLQIGLGYREALAEAADVAEMAFYAAEPEWPLAPPSPWD